MEAVILLETVILIKAAIFLEAVIFLEAAILMEAVPRPGDEEDIEQERAEEQWGQSRHRSPWTIIVRI